MLPTERLKGIEVFVSTADCGSFTSAAERLHLTSSAVGKAVARLEARLGTRLFERTTRKLALTEEGAAFYRTCIRVLGELEEAELVLAAGRMEPVGRLRIDLPDSYGRTQVMPLLLSFAELHPGLRPQISFTDRFVDLAEEGIDLAVRIGGPDHWPPSLGNRHLGHERLIFCAAPAYLARHGMPQSCTELLEHSAVLFGKPDGSIAPWLVAQDSEPIQRHSIEGRFIVGSCDIQVNAVVAGLGIAQLGTWLVSAQLKSGELVEVLPELATQGLPLHLVWLRSRQLLPKVDLLLAYLATHLKIG